MASVSKPIEAVLITLRSAAAVEPAAIDESALPLVPTSGATCDGSAVAQPDSNAVMSVSAASPRIRFMLSDYSHAKTQVQKNLNLEGEP
jgi:hypothetical protein